MAPSPSEHLRTPALSRDLHHKPLALLIIFLQLSAEIAVLLIVAMKHDEHDELWELLGKAREPKSSPFFASKVLRAIREESRIPQRVTFWQWFRQSWLLPTVASAAAAVAIFFALHDSPVSVKHGKGLASVPASGNGNGNGSGEMVMVKADPLSGLADAMSAMAASGDQDEVTTPLPELLATEDHSVWLQADPSSLF